MRTIRVLGFLAVITLLLPATLPGQQSPATAPPVNPPAAKDSLFISNGKSHDSATLTLADFKSKPHIMVTIHNPHSNTDETYSGVPLATLLEDLKAPLGKDLHGAALDTYVVATGSDGYKAVLALAEVDPAFHPGEIIVADAMNGKPLDARSGPFRLIVSEDKRLARCVRNLVSIELKSAE